jgi:hypothetical protein
LAAEQGVVPPELEVVDAGYGATQRIQRPNIQDRIPVPVAQVKDDGRRGPADAIEEGEGFDSELLLRSA